MCDSARNGVEPRHILSSTGERGSGCVATPLHATHAFGKESTMLSDTPSSDALGAWGTTHHGVEEAGTVSATAMARRDLAAKISAVDGCSEEQAEDEIRSFEQAFRAL